MRSGPPQGRCLADAVIPQQMISPANHRFGNFPAVGKNRPESHPHPVRKPLGFTLIELLASVAIVATLAVLLVPAFGKMLERAREGTCVSNLRQLSAGVALYCGDYDGRFPDSTAFITPTVTNGKTNTPPNYQWYVPLMGYVTHSGYTSNKGPYFCPSNLANLPAPGRTWPKQGWTTYGYNGNLIGVSRASVTKKIALFTDSYDATVTNADCANYGWRYSTPWYYSYGVHRGGQNVAFVDGSVEWVNVSPRLTRNLLPAGSDCVDMKAAWFWPLN